MRYLLALTTMAVIRDDSAGEDENLERSAAAGENGKLRSRFGERSGRSSKSWALG